jgi:hypothetical protein
VCQDGGVDSATDTDSGGGTDTDTGVDSGADSGVDSGHDTGVDSGVDTGGDTGPCRVTVRSTTPVRGSRNAYYRSPVSFELSAADATATIDAPVGGVTTVSSDGETVTFTPDSPLDPLTAYTFTLRWCGGESGLSFTTSELGSPLASVTSVEGRTYAFDLTTGLYVEPAGIGAVLASYFTQQVLLGVLEADSVSIDLRTSLAREGAWPAEQDTCTPSNDVDAADFSGQPWFAAGPMELVPVVAGFEVPLEDVTVEGTFAADGSYIGGGILTGMLDTRPLAPLVDDSGDEAAICNLAVSFGVTCVPCPDDGVPYCLSMRIEGLSGTEADGPLVERTAADIAADATCD